MRTQCASTVSLLMVADQAVKVKEDVDDELDSCRAVEGEKHLDWSFPWLGGETVQAVFRLLVHGPTIDIHFKDKVELNDLGIAPRHCSHYPA